MTPAIGSAITAKILQRLTAPASGANANLGALTAGGPSAPLFSFAQIRPGFVSPELTERAHAVTYPSVSIYCEKINNQLTEKFRTFSGVMQMAVEVRNSQDRVDSVQQGLETSVDSVMNVLDANRGDWGGGMFYAGGYQVAFGPVKQGGRGFLQTAKITFEIGVSIN
jgi:hypothetical protein